MTDAKNEAAGGASLSDAGLGADLTMPDFLRNQRNLVAERDAEIARLMERLTKAREAVAAARENFLSGRKNGGWTLCALRLALDEIDEGLNDTAPNG